MHKDILVLPDFHLWFIKEDSLICNSQKEIIRLVTIVIQIKTHAYIKIIFCK